MVGRTGREKPEDGSLDVTDTPEGLECGGRKYIQYIIRSFQVRITDLYIARGVSISMARNAEPHEFRVDPRRISIDSESTREELRGQAEIIRDSLGVIGQQDFKTRTLDVYLYRLDSGTDDEPKWRWRTSLFCSPADWEIGNEDSWGLTVYVPADEFDVLRGRTDRGKFGGAVMSMETDLWADEVSRHRPPSSANQWYLRPGKYSQPEWAHGIVTNLQSFVLSDGAGISAKENLRRLLPTDQDDVLREAAILAPQEEDRAKTGSAQFTDIRTPLQMVAGAIALLAVVLAIRL